MHKILLIINREYFSRVKKKSFLIMTFLVPIFFLGMWGAVIFLSVKDVNTITTVNVIDNNGQFINKLESNASLKYIAISSPVEEEKEKINQINDEHQYLLIIPKDILENQRVELYSSSSAGLFTQEQITGQLNTVLRGIQLNEAGIDTKILESIRPNIQVSSKEITTEGAEKDSNAGASMGISMFSSIIIYITLFIYGAQVMRGVIEEKNNRIVEIIISSVRPFQLMMGKIIGIGLVGLTQFILWILLSGGLFLVAGLLFDNSGNMADQMGKIGSVQQSPAMQNAMISDIQQAVSTINFPYIISTFLFYFIGGYLLYSALFAAVGSAVDNETETQQFMLPITMPLLFTYMMSFSVLLKDPSGPMAFWLSIIPFTSPIAMLVRIPFGVPAWQLALSMALLVLGFIFTTWVASRIYRVGILMYGKKASYKELLKWFNYKS